MATQVVRSGLLEIAKKSGKYFVAGAAGYEISDLLSAKQEKIVTHVVEQPQIIYNEISTTSILIISAIILLIISAAVIIKWLVKKNKSILELPFDSGSTTNKASASKQPK